MVTSASLEFNACVWMNSKNVVDNDTSAIYLSIYPTLYIQLYISLSIYLSMLTSASLEFNACVWMNRKNVVDNDTSAITSVNLKEKININICFYKEATL